MAPHFAARAFAGRSAARLAFVWAGVSIGVAFIATPAKFLASSLSLPVALDVGRQTFRLYNAVEAALAIVLVALALCSTDRRGWALRLTIPVAVVAAQALLLLPALDERAAWVQAGLPPPPSHLHAGYIAAEAAKVIALLVAGLTAGRRGASSRGDRFARTSWIPISPFERL